jgi:hypothetical protein
VFDRTVRNDHLSALRSLASLQPKYTLEAAVRAIEMLGGEESARFLDAMRMRTLVARRLAGIESPGRALQECLALLDPAIRKVGHMHEVLDANLARLDQIAIEAGLEIFGGKGISAHATYRDKSVRDFNDIDIFVRDRRDAVVLSGVLRTRFGYRYQKYELPWFKLDPTDDLVYGQIALVAPQEDPDLLNIDIHFGDYSVRHSSRLSITPTFPRGGPGLKMVAPEENLACIVNNAAGDYFITAKDTNDLLMALSRPAFDVDRFVSQLRRAHLDGFFGFIVETLQAGTVLTAEQDHRLRTIPRGRTLEIRPQDHHPSWNRRYLGTTLHTFSARRRDGLLPAARIAADAFAYYRKRLALSLRPPASGPAKPIVYNAWTCIRLVPLEIATGLIGESATTAATAVPLPEKHSSVSGDPEFERLDTPAGSYIRMAGEPFLATVDYQLDPQLIRHVARSTAGA